MATRTIDCGTDKLIIKYKDDQATKDAVFDKIVNWYLRLGGFSGESIVQNDACIMGAPELLADIADNFMRFDIDAE